MALLSIKKKNEVYVSIKTDEEYIHRELADYFSFEVPEAKFLKRNPRYKYWDGTIRLYSPATGDLPAGLYNKLLGFVQEHDYQLEVEKDEWYGDIREVNQFVSLQAVKVFMDKISKVKPRDYQYRAVHEALSCLLYTSPSPRDRG